MLEIKASENLLNSLLRLEQSLIANLGLVQPD